MLRINNATNQLLLAAFITLSNGIYVTFLYNVNFHTIIYSSFGVFERRIRYRLYQSKLIQVKLKAEFKFNDVRVYDAKPKYMIHQN